MLLYTQFTSELPKDIFAEYLSYLPQSMKETNSRYVRWEDRTSNLLGKILLLSGIKLLGLNFSLSDLKFNAYNKPFFNELVDFSISHSGKYIICVLGVEQKLGVDIEEIRPVEFSDFKQVFTPDQFKVILSSNDPHREFFKFWTIKESVQATLRRNIRRILRKYGYPPDKQEKATQTILQQAELLCTNWPG